MTRRLTLVFAAFEALLVVAIGVAIPVLIGTLMWAIQFGFAPDWAIFWRGAVDVWLIGHGVDVAFALDPATAAAIGVPEGEPITITIAALAFALLTLALGVRAGARVADTGHWLLGTLTALVVFVGASLLVTVTAEHPSAQPTLWQGAVLPAIVFGVGLVLGLLRADADQGGTSRGRLAETLASINPRARASIRAALVAGAASVLLVLAAAAILTAIVTASGYAQAIRLYETLHAGVLGGVVLTVAQLAFVPNVVVWAGSWLIGPGFALGVGSQVSPLGTDVGPLPAVPWLGVLPAGDTAFGFAGLAVPIGVAFIAALVVRPALLRAIGNGSRLGWSALVAFGGGAFGGVLFGLLAAASAGSLGPGRFSDIGPDPFVVGALAAGEFTLGLALGFAAASVSGMLRRPVE